MLILHKERCFKAETHKEMHLRNTTTNKYENCKFLLLLGFRIERIKIIVFVYLLVYFICKVEFAHWALRRLLQNSLGDLCSVWEAMNNMITLQYTEIKASFETSTHVVGHILKLHYTRDYFSWYQGMF